MNLLSMLRLQTSTQLCLEQSLKQPVFSLNLNVMRLLVRDFKRVILGAFEAQINTSCSALELGQIVCPCLSLEICSKSKGRNRKKNRTVVLVFSVMYLQSLCYINQLLVRVIRRIKSVTRHSHWVLLEGRARRVLQGSVTICYKQENEEVRERLLSSHSFCFLMNQRRSRVL